MLTYSSQVEGYVGKIQPLLQGSYPFHPRAIALLLLQSDEEMRELVVKHDKRRFRQINKILHQAQDSNLTFDMAITRQNESNAITAKVMSKGDNNTNLGGFIDWLTLWPPTAYPLVALILYFGMYRFVGGFGAGTLVDFLEDTIFISWFLPLINPLTNNLPLLFQDILTGDYGLISLGVRYAIAIILPIVGSFFFFFAFLEDTGYLPRLALMVDKACKALGLNGRAIIPLTLGLGCATMATIVTRTLETKRERLITTFLLALAIPCSAQMGLMLALLSPYPQALIIWLTVVLGIFLLAGKLSHAILPGQAASFYMELPPLRLPILSNIFMKTITRIQWYLKEILPIFMAVSIILWVSEQTGFLQLIITRLTYPIALLGLPADMAQVFLLGFFRRDYGAAGLYDLSVILSPRQLAVAATTLTLFIPCLAQVGVMIKERGMLLTIFMVILIIPIAFFSGFFLNIILGG